MIVVNRFIPNTAEGDYLCIRKVGSGSDVFKLTDQSGQVVYTMPVGSVYDEINLAESGAVTARYDTDVHELVRSKTSHATFFMLETISSNLVAYMQEVKKKIDAYADLVASGESATVDDIKNQLFVTFDLIDHELQLTKIDLGKLLGESYTEQDGLTLNGKLNLLAENLISVSQLLTTYVTLSSHAVDGTFTAFMADASGYGDWSNITCLLNNNLSPLDGLAGKVNLSVLQDVPIGSRNIVVSQFGIDGTSSVSSGHARYSGFVVPVTGRYVFYNVDTLYCMYYGDSFYSSGAETHRGGIKPFEPLTLYAGDLVLFGRKYTVYTYATDTQSLFFERLA